MGLVAAARSRRRWVVAAVVAALLGLGVLALWKGRRALEVLVLTDMKVVTLANGLDTPWSLAFLPDGRWLLSERPGRLRLFPRQGGPGALVQGLPPVWPAGGLMGIVVAADGGDLPWVYWSYMEPAEGDTGRNAVARGRLRGTQLEAVEVIFRDPQAGPDRGAFGSRLAFGPQGHLFVTLGDRSEPERVQRLDSYRGKLLRLLPDGRVPPDNPFVGRAGALDAIWALGFRDPQGIAVDPASGNAWVSDHGPLGGDEVNLVKPGANHGWPLVSYGCEEHRCTPIGDGSREKPGLAPAAIWWGEDVAVPPSALLRMDSPRYPDWRGELLLGTLQGQALLRLRVEGEQLTDPRPVYAGRAQRTRDLQLGPDGWLYLVTNTPDGRVLRLEPR